MNTKLPDYLDLSAGSSHRTRLGRVAQDSMVLSTDDAYPTGTVPTIPKYSTLASHVHSLHMLRTPAYANLSRHDCLTSPAQSMYTCHPACLPNQFRARLPPLSVGWLNATSSFSTFNPYRKSHRAVSSNLDATPCFRQ